jgi:hypothetical protein
MNTLLGLADGGTRRLFESQRQALRDVLPTIVPRP